MKARLIASTTVGFLCTPLDVLLVRIQRDLVELGLNKTQPTKNIFQAISEVNSTEGFFGFWRGGTMSMAKMFLLNMNPFNDSFKMKLSNLLGVPPSHSFIIFCSSAFSLYLAALISLPADNIAVKLQKGNNSQIHEGLRYAGVADCINKTLAREGYMGFWVGFYTFYSRILLQVGFTSLLLGTLRTKKDSDNP